MWHEGQQIICTNDRFSGAVWEWTSSVPRAGVIYTIMGMDYLPEWGSAGCVLGFRLRELPTLSPRTYFSAWRFEPCAFPAYATGNRRRERPLA
jgi:hypothetical protein